MTESPLDESEEVEISAELLWTLAHESNRCVVKCCHESDRDEVTVDELATYVADHHSNWDLTDPTLAEQILLEKSLPQLTDHALVDFDPDDGVVRSDLDHVPADLLEDVLSLD